jgi:hypothetical protein
MKVALVCVAKWEDYYLKEWLDYNEKLGFDKVIMYQNEWRTELEHPILEKRISDGRSIQVPTYNHFLNTEREYDWVAFFDCDEFLVLKKHNNIKELIEEYANKTSVIGLNWIFYGNLGKVSREGDSLIKQFPMRNDKTDQHIKVIVNKRTSQTMQLPHNTLGPAMDTNGKIFQGPFNPGGPMDVAYINHYHNKTKEDWELRCKRGRVDCDLGHDYNRWDEEININNQVEDLSAYNFLYGN